MRRERQPPPLALWFHKRDRQQTPGNAHATQHTASRTSFDELTGEVPAKRAFQCAQRTSDKGVGLATNVWESVQWHPMRLSRRGGEGLTASLQRRGGRRR